MLSWELITAYRFISTKMMLEWMDKGIQLMANGKQISADMNCRNPLEFHNTRRIPVCSCKSWQEIHKSAEIIVLAVGCLVDLSVGDVLPVT